MDLGIDNGFQDREASLMNPPPGLGSPTEEEEEDTNEQKKSQP